MGWAAAARPCAQQRPPRGGLKSELQSNAEARCMFFISLRKSRPPFLLGVVPGWNVRVKEIAATTEWLQSELRGAVQVHVGTEHASVRMVSCLSLLSVSPYSCFFYGDAIRSPIARVRNSGRSVLFPLWPRQM